MKYALFIITLFLGASNNVASQSLGRLDPETGCRSGNLAEDSKPPQVEEIRRFLSNLKSAVSKDDRTAVAGMVQFPMVFTSAGSKRTIRSQKEFLDLYQKIIPVALKRLILKQDLQCISRVGAQGYAIGLGHIWFDKYADGRIRIFTVNSTVYPGE